MNEHYLNQEEKDLVISFNTNTKMFDAVKKVLLHTVYNQGVLKAGEKAEATNWVFGVLDGTEKTDAEIALKLTSSLRGLAYLESGFKRLEEFKAPVDEVKKKKDNPAI